MAGALKKKQDNDEQVVSTCSPATSSARGDEGGGRKVEDGGGGKEEGGAPAVGVDDKATPDGLQLYSAHAAYDTHMYGKVIHYTPTRTHTDTHTRPMGCNYILHTPPMMRRRLEAC